MYNDVHLVVGLISDNDATSYKRAPIINETNRQLILESCKYVNEIIPNAPLIITKDFINLHKIDLVVHGFADPSDEKNQGEFFRESKELGKFKIIPYSNIESTTAIIKRIRSNDY
jgi:glycerol-3-phosphate cytidylyltransferase-like family protein